MDEEIDLEEILNELELEEVEAEEETVDKNGEVPLELGRQIEKKSKDLGLFAANLPIEVGGAEFMKEVISPIIFLKGVTTIFN